MHLRRKKSKTDLFKEQVQDMAEKAVGLTGRAAGTLAPKVESAKEVAGHALETASTKVRDDYVPRVRDEYAPLVRDKYAPLVRDKYAPRVREITAPAVAAALAKTGRTTVVAVPKPKTHRLRTLLLAVGLGGAVAFAAKKFGGSGQAPAPFPTRPMPVPRPTAVPDAEPTIAPVSVESERTGDPTAMGQSETDFGPAAATIHPDSVGGTAENSTVTSQVDGDPDDRHDGPVG
ncbi:MAG: hypothetical protein ACR2KL_12280 [Nocardioidaceae bacterium]